jgi:hypothetical protein
VSSHNHAALWIDHHEAHVVFFNADDAEEHIIHAPKTQEHIHSKAGSPSGTHLRGNIEFFGKVAETLAPAHAILVLGPSEAKTEFVVFVDKHNHHVRDAIVGVESAQHMTNKQLLAEARRYFKAADRLNPVFDLTSGKGVGSH